MESKSLNWQILLGFILSLFALVSYPFIFSQWPVTRDFPWANIILFVIAIVLLFVGLRKAFSAGRGTFARVGAVILSVIGVFSLGLFIFVSFVMSKWIPASAGAPRTGQKAHEFTLADTTGKQITLSQLLVDKKGVLLVFYRGYW